MRIVDAMRIENLHGVEIFFFHQLIRYLDISENYGRRYSISNSPIKVSHSNNALK